MYDLRPSFYAFFELATSLIKSVGNCLHFKWVSHSIFYCCFQTNTHFSFLFFCWLFPFLVQVFLNLKWCRLMLYLKLCRLRGKSIYFCICALGGGENLVSCKVFYSSKLCTIIFFRLICFLPKCCLLSYRLVNVNLFHTSTYFTPLFRLYLTLAILFLGIFPQIQLPSRQT